jgi:integrase
VHNRRKIAEEIRIRREHELMMEHVRGPQETATYAHAVADYIEHGGGERRFMKPLLDHFGVTPLRAIGQHEIDLAAKKLLPKAGPATRNRQVYTPMSAVMRHAAQRKWCDLPNLARPKVPKSEVRWLKRDEAERLIAACAPHLKPAVTFILYTGARSGEALYLDWRNVDLDRPQATFVKTKNGEARSVPLHPRLVAALTGLKHREGAVFRTPDGKPYSPLKGFNPEKGYSDTSAGTRIGTAFSTACERANIADFTPHNCRDTWATWFMQSGGTLADLKALGGWKSVAMVMKYAHADASGHAAAINRLPGGNLGEPNTATPQA